MKIRMGVAMTVGAAVFIVTMLSTWGDVHPVARAILQGAGTLGGIAFGFLIQKADDEKQLSSKAEAAIGNLVAMARSLQALQASAARVREDLSKSDVRTISGVQAQADAALAGVEDGVGMLLPQAQAAAEVWRPYSTRYAELTGEAKVREGSSKGVDDAGQ